MNRLIFYCPIPFRSFTKIRLQHINNRSRILWFPQYYFLYFLLLSSKNGAYTDCVIKVLLFYSQLFINIEFYYEEKYKLVGASILAAVVNIVLNYFGIKLFGFVAAGYTTLISYILFAGCNYFAMKKICRNKGIEDDMYDYKALVGLFTAFAAIGFVFAVLYPYRWVRLGMIAAGLIVGFLMKDRLLAGGKKALETIKSKD